MTDLPRRAITRGARLAALPLGYAGRTALGVGKINVNTESQVEFSRVVRKTLEEKPDLYDSRKYLGPAREAIKEIIRAKIRLFGSHNRF